MNEKNNVGASEEHTIGYTFERVPGSKRIGTY